MHLYIYQICSNGSNRYFFNTGTHLNPRFSMHGMNSAFNQYVFFEIYYVYCILTLLLMLSIYYLFIVFIIPSEVCSQSDHSIHNSSAGPRCHHFIRTCNHTGGKRYKPSHGRINQHIFKQTMTVENLGCHTYFCNFISKK